MPPNEGTWQKSETKTYSVTVPAQFQSDFKSQTIATIALASPQCMARVLLEMYWLELDSPRRGINADYVESRVTADSMKPNKGRARSTLLHTLGSLVPALLSAAESVSRNREASLLSYSQ